MRWVSRDTQLFNLDSSKNVLTPAFSVRNKITCIIDHYFDTAQPVVLQPDLTLELHTVLDTILLFES